MNSFLPNSDWPSMSIFTPFLFIKTEPLISNWNISFSSKKCFWLTASTYHFSPFESHQSAGPSHQGHQAQACPATHRTCSTADDDFVPRCIRLRLLKTWYLLLCRITLLLDQQYRKYIQCCAHALSAYVWKLLTPTLNPLESESTHTKISCNQNANPSPAFRFVWIKRN